MNKIFLSGSAGFIGHHLALKLASEGYEVYGIDNLNNYYGVQLKIKRLELQGITTYFENPLEKFHRSSKNKALHFRYIDISKRNELSQCLDWCEPDIIIHLAAQAGVRYSIENPQTYIDSNIQGFQNISDLAKEKGIDKIIYASSSSVYGKTNEMPYVETASCNTPLSLYAMTKKSNEMLAATYSHLYDMSFTGLRFFTVYGPWGRPDMALFKFTKNILNGDPIDVYNNGEMYRDFTYVDDIVESVYQLTIKKLKEKSGQAINELFNIGNGKPVKLIDFIVAIEECLGIKAKKNMMPLQPGDMEKTYCNAEKLFEAINFRPQTKLEDGVAAFIDWYKAYYKNPHL